MRGLDRATAFIRAHHGAHAGRIRGMLYPLQVDTCSPELFRATRKAADELGVGISTHVGQNLVEFHEILRRHGKTPVELLDESGLLGPGTILGHCLMTTAHRLAALPAGRDLDILARSGVTVAHCPLVFARRGNALESFHRYRAAGVNVGLGTDTYPRDLISEMRWASLLCKVVEHDFTVATAAEVFDAATLAGARALRRDDIGRLAPGSPGRHRHRRLAIAAHRPVPRPHQGPRQLRHRRRRGDGDRGRAHRRGGRARARRGRGGHPRGGAARGGPALGHHAASGTGSASRPISSRPRRSPRWRPTSDEDGTRSAELNQLVRSFALTRSTGRRVGAPGVAG